MANTYSQLYMQIVFSVKSRDKAIPPAQRDEVHKYITALVADEGQKLLAIFCMPDHIHILVSFNPEMAIAQLVRKIKTDSSKFINPKNWMPAKFQWQSGYGVFSYSKSQVKSVVRYILNQEQHHEKKSFKTEYRQFMEKFGVDYDERYLFDLA